MDIFIVFAYILLSAIVALIGLFCLAMAWLNTFDSLINNKKATKKYI